MNESYGIRRSGGSEQIGTNSIVCAPRLSKWVKWVKWVKVSTCETWLIRLCSEIGTISIECTHSYGTGGYFSRTISMEFYQNHFYGMCPHICVTDFMCKPWLLRNRRIWADRNHFYRMCSHIYVTDSYVCHDSYGIGGFEQIGTISIVCAPTPSCECSGIDVWCHIYEWVMSRIWMSHVTYMNESCHIYERVMSHI